MKVLTFVFDIVDSVIDFVMDHLIHIFVIVYVIGMLIFAIFILDSNMTSISTDVIETEYTQLYITEDSLSGTSYYIEVDGVAVGIDSNQYDKFLMSDDKSCTIEVSVMRSGLFKRYKNKYRLVE